MKTNKIASAFSTTVALTALVLSLASCQNNGDNIAKNPDKQKPEAQTVSQTKNQPKKQDSLAQFDQKKSDSLTDTAKALAGMNLDAKSSLAAIQKNSGWQSHQSFFENSWSKLDKQQLSKVKEWTSKELQDINTSSTTVFYPFSGPDFLYSYSLFPKAKQFVLAGLEPVGEVADLAKLSASQQDRKLQEARSALYAILQFSFFRTNAMKVDLEKQGVSTILNVFLARTNNRILDVQKIGLDADGNVKPFQKGMISGVKIAFAPQGESEARTLYYFSTDLSNDGMKKQPGFSKFAKKLENKVTYLKAASYLMYNDSFSEIRDFILANSSHVLQDDSGMPLKSFASSQWDLKFYGSYTQPISLFKGSYQADLKKVYQSNKSIKPLDFGIGYKFGVNESNLMLATTKKLARN
ncbi:MAG: hypothetical protein KME64_35615 [Scytonematopsis contorta HA4267-MV1]|jgi:hypothetical protein|nr:hypothetical protein [Scytonematopsis contorta HA4267-MV1]